MRLILLGLLAFCVFVVFNTSPSEGDIIVPGNSTDEVVLVGYSADLKQENWSCIKSRYNGTEGDWVKRTLEYRLKEGNINQDVKMHIKIKLWKYRDVLELDKQSWLRRLTYGSNKYLIRYYDNKSLVMSNFIQNISVLEPCSFWVKTQYLNSITELANDTFRYLCRNATFVGYDTEACKDRFLTG
uniref:Putative group viii salivary lipocalin n=1 Tax=Rhipicephalus pulchellus TaxID=72859 RepID=L7M9J3_RHIPC